MSVHYKFKSSLDYDTVTFDSLHISVADLKKAILQQKKIGKGFDFDLKITNAQTKEVYSDDDCLIPKNASVIVSRVPTSSTAKKGWERNDSPSLLPVVANNDSDSVSFDKVTKSADLVSANASEDEKIRAMMSQSTLDYDPSRYVKTKTMVGPTPTNYTCYRCGRTGHWIKNCPTNAMDVKRSTGIPRSFMVTVDGPDVPGALLTSTGHYAVPMIDHEAYKEGKKEKPPFTKEPSPVKEEVSQIPNELLCMICHDLLTDAVLIPCCGNSYCDECVRQALLDSDEHECPTCHEKDISPDTLIPVRLLRQAVLNFKNETGYIKMKKPDTNFATENEPSCSSRLTEAEHNLTQVELEKDTIADSKDIGKLDHPDTPVRDELVDVNLGVDVNNTVNSTEVVAVAAAAAAPAPAPPVKEEPTSFSIKTITTRQLGVGPPVQMMPGMKINRIPPLRDGGPYPPHDPYMDPNMRHNHHIPPPHRDMDPMRMGLRPHPHMQGRAMHHMPYRPQMPPGAMHPMHPAYRQMHPMMKPPMPLQRGVPMPPGHMANVPPPPNHMMNLSQPPQSFYPHLRHPPPPVPNSFAGPPPNSIAHRRPSPTDGTTALPPTSQPLPPGVRPPTATTTSHGMPQSLPPTASYHPPGIPQPYPPRHDEYYQEQRPYPESRVPLSTGDPLDAFARELIDYRNTNVRRRSASSSRSYSSRSGYRSRSGSRSGRSRSRSTHSKSRSYSSRSGSGSYSRSRSRSRSHRRSRSPASRSRSHTRSRSRSKPRSKYSPPKHRRSRSASRDRSPLPSSSSSKSQLPPVPLPPNRRRYPHVPNTYYNYRDIQSGNGGPPSHVSGPVHPHPPPGTYDMHRGGRYMDYRYENYNHHGAYEEDPRYLRDPRYEYLRYEDYYHQQGPPRPMRGSWPEQSTQDATRPRDNRDYSATNRRPPASASRRSRSRESSVDRHISQQSASGDSVRRRKSRSRSPARNSRSERDDRSKPRSRHEERDSKSSHGSSRRDTNYKDYNSSSNRSNSVSRDGKSSHKNTDHIKNKDSDAKESSSHSKNVDETKTSHSEKHREKKHKRSKNHHSGDSESTKKSKTGKKSSSEVDTEAEGDASRKGNGKKKKQKNKDSSSKNGDAQDVFENDDESKSVDVSAARDQTSPVVDKKPAAVNDGGWPEEPEDGDAINPETERKDDELVGSLCDAGAIEGEPSPPHESPSHMDFTPNQDDDKTGADNEQELAADAVESADYSDAEQDQEQEAEDVENDEGDANDDEEETFEHNVAENVGSGDVLTAQVPELSKWERDFEREDIDVNRTDDASQNQQRSKAKTELPADIVQRAEKAILEKAPKAIVTSGDGRKIEVNKSVEGGGSGKEKEIPSAQSTSGNSRDKFDAEKKESESSTRSRSKRSMSSERKREKGKVSDSRKRERSPERERPRISRSPRRRSRSVEGKRDSRRRDASRSRSRDDRRRHKRERSDSRSRTKPSASGKSDRGRSDEKPKKASESSKRDNKKDDSNEKNRRGSSSPSKLKKGSDEQRQSKEKVNEIVPRERKHSSATIDESKFEPDYDTPSDDETAPKRQQPSASKIEDDKSQAAHRRSSSSSSSDSGSSDESTESAEPAKKKRRKSIDAPSGTNEKSSGKHDKKNKKHKKHKKHKHKHKKSKKSHKHKDESGTKDGDNKKSKSKR